MLIRYTRIKFISIFHKQHIAEIIYIFIAFSCSEVLADPGLTIYEKGYILEKEYPLFSIPLYEKTLKLTVDTKLKRIVATRLYYLYKKFKKYPDLLIHHSKYNSLLAIGSEHESTIKDICETYNISGQDFYKVYPILYRMDFEEIGNLLELITNSDNKNLFALSYSFLISARKFEELRTIIFYLPESIVSPILRIGLLVKQGDETTADTINKFLESDGLTERDKSDAFYLLGQYLMQIGNYMESEKAFLLSQRYGDSGRGLRERGKLLIIQGRIQESCSQTKYPRRDFHESDFLLYLICSQTKSTPNEIKESVRILSEGDNRFFFQAAIPLL